MTRVVLSLGSNVGDRLAHLQAGASSLEPRGVVPVAISHVYETTAVGGPAQGDYLNVVVVAETQLPARDVLAVAQHVEAERGRVRVERWGPRTLDVDVISYDDTVSDDPFLTLPHPRADDRAFVLVPWAEADPAATLPDGRRVAELAARIGREGVTRRHDLVVVLP